MITCEQLLELLPDYLGDELGPKQQEQLHEHLAQCETCYQEVTTLTGTQSLLQNLKGPPMPSSALVQSAPVGRPVALSARVRLLRSLSYAAMLVIGVTAGWAIRPPLSDRNLKTIDTSAPSIATTGEVHPDWIEGFSGVSPAQRGSSVLAQNMAAFSRSISTGG